MVAGITPGSRVVMVGAGFIAFTILNAILARGARLTIVEVAPRILPRMVDDACAGIVQRWLEAHGVAVRTGATVTKIEQAGGKRKLSFKKGEPLTADVVIMATGIRTNLEWLQGSGIEMGAEAPGGIIVDDHLRSSVKTVYAAGDVARGREPHHRRAPRCTPSSRPRRSTGAWSAPTWRAATWPTAAACS